VEARSVSARYFRTLGIPLLRGRDFTEDDVVQQRAVTVINRQMAGRFWPGADPIGQRVISAYHPENSKEIIGVVENIKDSSLDRESPAEMYAPYGGWNMMNLVLRSRLDPSALVAAVRAQVERLDRGVPVYDVRHMNDVVSGSMARQRFELFLLALFAAIALSLAVVGIYGLLSFAVSRRTHEIGLRMALGANPRGVLALILGQGMKLIGAGAVLGIGASFGLTRLMSGLLFETEPADPLTLAAMAALLAAAGGMACWIPARRAMSIDPMTALAAE